MIRQIRYSRVASRTFSLTPYELEQAVIQYVLKDGNYQPYEEAGCKPVVKVRIIESEVSDGYFRADYTEDYVKEDTEP